MIIKHIHTNVVTTMKSTAQNDRCFPRVESQLHSVHKNPTVTAEHNPLLKCCSWHCFKCESNCQHLPPLSKLFCPQNCSLTSSLQVLKGVNTPKGQRLHWLSQQTCQWLVPGTFTPITTGTVGVVISGQRGVWKQAARHYGENWPKADFKKALLN